MRSSVGCRAALRQSCRLFVTEQLLARPPPSPPRQHRPQRHRSVVHLDFHQFLRRASRHHRAAFHATSRRQINHPIGFGDHVQVVFDGHHAVAAVDLAVQHADELFYVGHVQAEGGLVEQGMSVQTPFLDQ
jgi:hypothetical protein